MVAVAYKRWSFTRGSINYKALNGNVLVLWIVYNLRVKAFMHIELMSGVLCVINFPLKLIDFHRMSLFVVILVLLWLLVLWYCYFKHSYNP